MIHIIQRRTAKHQYFTQCFVLVFDAIGSQYLKNDFRRKITRLETYNIQRIKRIGSQQEHSAATLRSVWYKMLAY